MAVRTRPLMTDGAGNFGQGLQSLRPEATANWLRQ